MANQKLADGLYHKLPSDFKKAPSLAPEAVQTWEYITPIARNEWICWIITVKQEKTRIAHIKRACSDLATGKRRPCCWVGCTHRTDKPVGKWAQKMLLKKLGGN